METKWNHQPCEEQANEHLTPNQRQSKSLLLIPTNQTLGGDIVINIAMFDNVSLRTFCVPLENTAGPAGGRETLRKYLR